MPKPYVAAYQPTVNNTEKLNKNKRRKIKKKAKKKKELLEQQVKEFASTDPEQLKDQESLNGLKDCNLDDGELDDDAEACGASADEECGAESAGPVRTASKMESKTENKTESKMETEDGQQQQQQQNNRQNDPSSSCKGENAKSGELNGKRKELSTSKDSSKDSKSNEPGGCLNGDRLNGSADGKTAACPAATGQGKERTTNLHSPSSELMNNFSLIFEEIKQQINTAAESSTRKQQRKADPAREVCSVNVKIADLGNGCWVVGVPERRAGRLLCSLIWLFVITGPLIISVLYLFCRTSTSRMTFKRDSTDVWRYCWAPTTDRRAISGALPAWRSNWPPAIFCSIRSRPRSSVETKIIWRTSSNCSAKYPCISSIEVDIGESFSIREVRFLFFF